MKKKKLLPLFAAVCIASAAYAGVVVHAETEYTDTIADGVYIGSIDVGGMTEAEAVDAVNSYVDGLGTKQFTLAAGSNSITVSGSDLGLRMPDQTTVMKAMDVCKTGSLIKRYKDKKDLEHGDKIFELTLSADKETVKSLLEEKAGDLNQEAVDCELTRNGEVFEIVDGKQGIQVNIDDSVENVLAYIDTEWDKETSGTITLAADVVEPRGTKEELSKVKDLLGGFSTNFSTSSSNRCTNIAVAAGKINGTLLYPGEEFSVYETIGPMDAANGYELAGAYENGQTVESYGGGVCQVSTTLYNAVILSELEITQRSNHSMIVTYVKPSMDAAIAGDYKDLRFKNNQDSPIYIEGYTAGKDLYFNIFGAETRPSNRKISFESEVVSTDDPPTKYVGTGDPAGSMATAQGKHTGYVAQLWKIVTVDGVEQSREIFNKSTYKASPKIVNVGTASPDPNISAIIGAALESGDEAAILAAVAQAQAAVAPPPDQQPTQETWNPQ